MFSMPYQFCHHLVVALDDLYDALGQLIIVLTHYPNSIARSLVGQVHNSPHPRTKRFQLGTLTFRMRTSSFSKLLHRHEGTS